MFDGNMAVLVECYKVHLLIMEQKLNINAIYIWTADERGIEERPLHAVIYAN